MYANQTDLHGHYLKYCTWSPPSNLLHHTVLWVSIQCEGIWLGCTKPRHEPYWTPLGWIKMLTVSQTPSPNISALMLLYGRKSLQPCTVPSSTYSRKPLNMSYGTYGCVRPFYVYSWLSFSVHIMAFYCARRKWNQHALNKYTLHKHMCFLIFYVFLGRNG